MRESLLVEASSLEMRIDESDYPDDLTLLPRTYAGPELVAVAYANALATLTTLGRSTVPLSIPAATALYDAAERARAEDVEPGVDTAVSRTITSIRVRVDSARGPSSSYALHANINHCAARALPPAWSQLLRTLCDAAGPLPAPVAAAWDLALTWTGAIDLGPAWAAGEVVKLPHIVQAIDAREPFFLRTSQRVPTTLYRVDADGSLVDVDRGVIVEPDPERPWTRRLPCGGGTLAFHHEWRTPPRVVIRVDDVVRGIYVQRAS